MFGTLVMEREGLPAGLTELAPGPELAAILATIDRDGLSGYDRVALLKARARQVAYDQAEFYADINSIHEYETENPDNLEGFWTSDVDDLVASEMRAALTLTRRSADHHLGVALDLKAHLPQVWAALRAGVIDLAKARVICDGTGHLEEGTARLVAEQALERAPKQTTGELAARIRRLSISVDPESAKKKYEEAVEERRVTSQANPDGTTNLYGLDLPVDQANAAMRRINQLARAAKSAHDQRTMDQIRADVFLDLLTGRCKHSRNGNSGVLDIQVDLTTLAGLDDHPGELNGYGPVIADIARQVVREQGDSEHRVTVTDPDTGQVLWNGTTRRRPSASLKRHVETRNPTCTFPGCRMPATDCDLDHNLEWAKGGATEAGNLAPFCRHDHVIRHNGWKVKQLQPGTYQLTSPLGHSYTTGPDPP